MKKKRYFLKEELEGSAAKTAELLLEMLCKDCGSGTSIIKNHLDGENGDCWA